ncbi:hypothetical protein CASFOL_010539 [Castilleja foliolosa]|uniref:Uncharacterized protein n=1 Tax=Castilleja foliolosa TaxID=1961234 RepID=A0ABD3DU24_9LAMI
MNKLSVNSSLQFLALIICLPFVLSQKCSSKVKPAIFVFGDANFDTGGFAAVSGLLDGPPYGRIFPDGQLTGRTSDGKLVIDLICENLGTKYISAYLDALDQPDFGSGASFAILGACALESDYPARYINIDLPDQLNQFKLFHNRSTGEVKSKNPKLISPLKKNPTYFTDALYAIDMGRNDVTYASLIKTHDQVTNMIPSMINEIRKAISDIYDLGGRKIVVFSVEPVGCSPAQLAAKRKQKEILDKNNCIKSLNDAAIKFNAGLKDLCKGLQSQMKDATIVFVDVYSIKNDLIANYKSYGFDKPLTACCGYGGGAYNFDPNGNKTCWTKEYNNLCKPSEKYISWDGIHYTEAANRFVADKIISTNYSTPAVKLSDLFCSSGGKGKSATKT